MLKKLLWLLLLLCFIDNVYTGFTQWTEWGACNHACGVGQRFRSRSCDPPFSCSGIVEEAEHCCDTICQPSEITNQYDLSDPQLGNYSCLFDPMIASKCQFDEGNTCIGESDDRGHYCICSAEGYEVKGTNCNTTCEAIQCSDLTGVNEYKLKQYCGEHAIGCNNTIPDRICICDSDSYLSSDGRYCYEASCRASDEFRERCGEENSCLGTADSFICICDGIGYAANDTKSLGCKLIDCNEGGMKNYFKSFCGEGMDTCTGNVKDLTCSCTSSYVQSQDRRSCVPNSCTSMSEGQCGEGNTCIGTYNSWRCVCDAFGYKADTTDWKKCALVMCDDDDPNFMNITTCGPGAIGCTGPILNPNCECNTTDFYVPSPDGTRCEKASCMADPDSKTRCKEGNSCLGIYGDFICVCSAPGYRLDPSSGDCVEIQCTDNDDVHLRACGYGSISCTGTERNPTCKCNATEYYYPNSADSTYCVKEPCKADPLYEKQCGVANSCYGLAESFECVCNGPGYVQSPSNRKQCLLATCESGALDPEYFCGRGALSCTGNITDGQCNCDNANGYVRKPGGQGCIKNDCRSNDAVQKQCGSKNKCAGSLNDWRCICDTRGYKPVESDSQTCGKVMCGDPHPAADHIDVCGQGAISCSGHILNPTCVCNTTENVVASSDGRSCIPASCKSNPVAMEACGFENSCSGNYHNYICICDAYGYSLDGSHQSCVKKKCDDADADYEEICGTGGISCNGTMDDPYCFCNTTDSFVTSDDGKSCVKASCRSSPLVSRQCGEANSCFGNADSYICACTAAGYKRDETNPRSCALETCEDNELDHSALCGKGSIGCSGNILNLTCICDDINGYVQSEDGKQCVANTCYGDPTMREQCGDGNLCSGGLTDWFCICVAPGYEPHKTDPKQCTRKMCSDTIAEDVCGIGATKCEGPIMKHRCECDKSRNFMPAVDGRRCLKESCENNPMSKDNCGPLNRCVGSYDNYYCVCDAYGFKAAVNNDQVCPERHCSDADADFVEICGTGAIGCTGSIRSPYCKCNELEYYFPTPSGHSCIMGTCRANETISKMCGDGNTCMGSMESHICICEKPGYRHNSSDSKTCVQETCENGYLDPVTVCGKGATGCKGSLDKLICECNNEMNYVQSANLSSCIRADCRANVSVIEQCGAFNRCRGSLTNWVCICDAPGYKADETDYQRCHQKTCEDSGVDPTEVCGIGATLCAGPVATPLCECDTAANYVPSADRYSCIPASCKSNKTALEQCGEMNSCRGTHDNFICVCDAYGYRLDDKDNQRCIKKTCSDADADYVEICGQGGVKCHGVVGNHQCECDTDKYFVPSPDQGSCVFSNCRANDTALRACGKANSCFGSTTSFICVCDAPGYKQSPSNLQECMKKTCEAGELDAIKVCGKGATGCKGSLDNIQCMCDNNLGFAVSPDQKSCIPADCRADPKKIENCGELNQCVGSLNDWMCVCDAPGYYADENDLRKCRKEMCSEPDVDPEIVCGAGAISCIGPVVSPICFCDTSKNVVASSDGNRCIPATCHTNKTAVAQCGDGNSCTGSSDNFICVCDGYGYKLDDNNNQACVEKTCSDGDADIIEICGEGGLSCTGSMRNPVCECDHTKNYIPSNDRRSCVLASCRTNPDVKVACGKLNSCYGSESSWICNCDAPGYMLNPNNIRECLAETCENGDIDAVTVCGRGALSCSGSMVNLTCICNNALGFVQSPDRRSCLPSDCHQNETMHEQCGEGNECIGSLTDWNCICTAPGYRAHDSDRQRCHQITCSDENVDHIDVCGVGAIACAGPVVTPRCTCDASSYYVPSSDGFACIPAPCHSNKTALQQCGHGNECSGTVNNFFCVCNAYGYKLDDSDPHRCIEISCDDDGVDLHRICGHGSTSCEGTARNPVCQCDHANHYVPSLDSSSCLLASCQANETVMDMCGEGNTCFGSMTSHICVCQAKGYKVDPLDTSKCLEETCENDEINVLAACGKGSTACRGTLKNIECDCGDGYVQSADKTSCLPVHCRHNQTVASACGDINACIGSYYDWYCDCTSFGFMPHPTDKAVCLLKQCGSDPVASCGLGATKCIGDLYEHVCECNYNAGYILSDDHQSCVPGDCKMNPNMNCGFGNTCQGTYFSYVCICSTSGTIRNPDNAMTCMNVDCPTNAVSVCGAGATSCEVTSTNDVKCSCGPGYHTSYDLNSCVVDDCKYNPEVASACGTENECMGSYLSWMCVCKGPQYIQDPENPRSCIPGPCRIEKCGSGKASGSFQYYADSCNGTYFEYNCTCEEFFDKDELGGCVPKSCKENPAAIAECGDNGICEGTYFKYSCKCNKPAFMQNPENKTECIEAPCHPKQCGGGLMNGYYVEFASSCEGTYNDHTCICKHGFYGTGTSMCYSELEACGKYGKCHEQANCVNYGGGYRCECKQGYSGDGMNCYLDGGLSAWTVTEKCNATCGDSGFATVRRACDNPLPDPNGQDCGVSSPQLQREPCNRFTCTDCTVRKACECSTLTTHFVDDLSEPDESLKYFTDIDSKVIEKSVSMLKHWTMYLSENICTGKSASIIAQNLTQIENNVQELEDLKTALTAARDLMRKTIDCNINLPRKDKYFGIYTTIVKHHFAANQLVKELKIKEDLLIKYRNECEDSKVGWLRKVIEMKN